MEMKSYKLSKAVIKKIIIRLEKKLKELDGLRQRDIDKEILDILNSIHKWKEKLKGEGKK